MNKKSNIKINEKILEKVLEMYRKEEITASKAARTVGIPSTLFFDILYDKKINYNYDIEDLREYAKSLDTS